jgi:integrase-like protein
VLHTCWWQSTVVPIRRIDSRGQLFPFGRTPRRTCRSPILRPNESVSRIGKSGGDYLAQPCHIYSAFSWCCIRLALVGGTIIVPMTPEVYRVFTELWQERRLDTQPVFLYQRIPVRDVKTAFGKACKRAGITNLRLHDLRHTASTNLRRAGVDATTAMKIVGHKSERMPGATTT